MGIASLVISIFATILAICSTAPFFGLIAPVGACFALVGIVLAITEFIRSGIRPHRDPEWAAAHLSAAKRGLVTSVLALFWSVGMFVAVKGPI